MFNRGEVMNGGFGLVLDGSEEAGKRARMMLNWDVSNGVRGFNILYYIILHYITLSIFSFIIFLLQSCLLSVNSVG